MSMALYKYIFSDFLHISSSQMSWIGTSSNRFYCADTGGLLVSEGIVLPVVSSSALIWFYFFYIYV